MTAQFHLDQLGKWSPEHDFAVDEERVRAYAAATNDPIALHRDGELAPPVFAIVPLWDTLLETVGRIASPELALLAVHGEQDMRFHQPIVPGMTLRSRGAPVGVHSKPSGTTVVSRLESRDGSSGALVNEQYCVTFFRGVAGGDGGGEQAPDHRMPATRPAGPTATVTQHFDDDQTFRYSKASGDLMPIHLDAEIARSVGLPGIIIHGLCTMAFTSWAAIEQLAGGDPRRLRRLAVRFSRPVLPGDDVTTRFWSVGVDAGAETYAYEAANPAGDAVIKDGLAEVAS